MTILNRYNTIHILIGKRNNYKTINILTYINLSVLLILFTLAQYLTRLSDRRNICMSRI